MNTLKAEKARNDESTIAFKEHKEFLDKLASKEWQEQKQLKRNIVIETMKADPKMAGKPDEMIAKIAEGKLNAFFKEQTLMAQPFVKDGGKTVAEYLKSVSADLKVLSFKRVALG